MNERMRESLSALMDDEANELELERVLSQFDSDKQLRETWMHYSLAQQAVHGEQLAHRQWDISARVKASLEEDTEAGVAASAAPGLRQRMLRPMISVGVAASVALTVVVGGQQLANIDSADPFGSDQSIAASASPVGMLNSLGATPIRAGYVQSGPVLQPTTRTGYQDLAQQRMRKYMQAHVEQAALNSPQGLVPFARVPEIQE